MKKFLVFLMTIALIFPFSGCSKKNNLSELSQNLSNYEICLEFDCNTKTANVNQTISYVNNTGNILKHIKFHLYPQFFKEGSTDNVVPMTKMNNAYPNGMSYASFNIERLCVDNNDKNIVYENEFDSILSVELNNSLMPNECTEISIEFSFTLPNCHHRFGYGENTINISNFYPIACVYENGEFNTNGYNSNGDPFYSDMSNYSVNISLDSQYVVAGTGEKISENVLDGNKQVSFKALVVRDFAMVLSDKFQVASKQFEKTNIEYYYFNDSHFQDSLNAGFDAIKTFSNLFGEYPYSTFSVVQTDFLHGGMEYPNLVMISSDITNKDDYLNVIIHETAHQWWYGLVGNDEFTLPWLDEALTEFSTIMFYDHNPNYAFSHKQMIDASRENYSLFVTVYEDVLGSLDTSMRSVDKYATEPEYTYCIYVKGVLMFESLYQLIGEKTFIKSLNNYFENNKFHNASTENLILSFNNVTGQNLSNFFDSWLKGKVVIR